MALLDAIVEDFLHAGNFGCREAGRAASLEIGEKSLAGMVKRRFSEAEKHPLLVPAYTAKWAARYVAMVATGKRKPIRPSTVLGARSRRELYVQFRLFEV